MKRDKIDAGLESLNRIKLLMEYDLKKTYSENIKEIISEQVDNMDYYGYVKINTPNGVVYNLVSYPRKFDIKATNIFPYVKSYNELPKILNVYFNSIGGGTTPTKSQLYGGPPPLNVPNFTQNSSNTTSEFIEPYTANDGVHIGQRRKPSDCGKGFVWDPNYINCKFCGKKPSKDAMNNLQKRYKGVVGYKSEDVYGQVAEIPKEEQCTCSFVQQSGTKPVENFVAGKCVPLTPQTASLRGIPLGFHKDEWNEFKTKFTQVLKKYGITPTDKMLKNPFKNKPGRASFPQTGNGQNDAKRYDSYESELNALFDRYYHPDFAEGILPADLENYKKAKAAQAKAAKERLDKAKSDIYRGDKSGETLYDLSGAAKIKQQQLFDKTSEENQIDAYIDGEYGYDPTFIEKANETVWDKWVEKNRGKIELVAMVATSLVAPVVAGALTSSGALMWIIEKSIEASLPLAFGYQGLKREGSVTPDVFMNFMFAVLPFASELYALKFKPSKEVCESILKKIRVAGDINTKEGFNAFLLSLNNEERVFIQEVNSLSLGQLKNGTDELVASLKSKDISKLKGLQSKSVELTGKSITGMSKIAQKASLMVKELAGMKIIEALAASHGLISDESEKQKMAKYFESLQGIDKINSYTNAIDFLKKNPSPSSDELISYLKKTKTGLDIQKEEDFKKALEQVQTDFNIFDDEINSYLE